MKLERLEALLWERIDGVIDDGDRAELEAFLAEHQGARVLDEELTALAEGLGKLDRRTRRKESTHHTRVETNPGSDSSVVEIPERKETNISAAVRYLE